MFSPASLTPLRVAPSGRYFETTSGEPFLFLGVNDSLAWPGLAPLYRRRDVDAVDAYLADLAENGINTLRLMLEYVHREHRYFEYPRVGIFNPNMVQFWDDLFVRCERFGLRILLAPWDNFWMARRWKRHPYNRINGGPAEHPSAFFTDEATIQATLNRFRFVIERWGNSPALAAWDLFNEIDPYWGGTPEQQGAVIARISEEVRTMEQRAWGWTRPQTVSFFGPAPSAEYENLIFRHPSLDFATTHVYEGAIDFPPDTRQPAETMAKWVRHALERTPSDRPYLDTEHGPIHLFNDHRKFLDEPTDDRYERRLMWAHLATGGAGSGMRWPARHPHLTTPGMRRAIGGMAAFSRSLDWRNFRSEQTSILLDPPRIGEETVRIFGCGDANQSIAYVLREGVCQACHTSGQIPPVYLTFTNLALGTGYCALVWDVENNQRLTVLQGCRTADDRGGMRFGPLPLAEVTGDIAVAVFPDANST